jgi:hypothetical protein
MRTWAAVATVLLAATWACAAAPDDVPDGPFKEYYPNGKVGAEGMVKNGQRNGDWRFYSPNGTHLYTLGFKDGERVVPPPMTIKDEKLGFTVTIPAGFVDFPGGAALMPGNLYTRALVHDDSKITVICIRDLGLLLPDEPPSMDAFLEGVQSGVKRASGNLNEKLGVDAHDFSSPGVSSKEVIWGAFHVWQFRLLAKADIGESVTFGTFIPLKPHGIIVMSTGPVADEKEVEQATSALLASLDGPAGYATSRAEKLGEGVGTMAVIAVVVYFVIRSKKKRAAAALEPPLSSLEIDDAALPPSGEEGGGK